MLFFVKFFNEETVYLCLALIFFEINGLFVVKSHKKFIIKTKLKSKIIEELQTLQNNILNYLEEEESGDNSSKLFRM